MLFSKEKFNRVRGEWDRGNFRRGFPTSFGEGERVEIQGVFIMSYVELKDMNKVFSFQYLNCK